MRYPDPKKEKSLKTFSFPVNDFMYGINDDTGDIASKGDILKDCVNMEYTGKSLVTRKGFKANGDSLLELSGFSDTVYIPFTVTETVYFDGNEPKNLAYRCTGYSDSATLDFYLVDGSGNISPAGNIVFNRVDSQYFYIPVSVFFFVAQPVTGNGVFAFVYRESRGEVICEPYEADAGFSEWTSARGSYYVPTVLINGRGEQYYTAESENNLALPEPDRPEELNLLSGNYRCYYTSDGFSSHFRLPYGNLSPYGMFYCRIYTEPDVYTEWAVDPTENYKAASFLGATVYMYINRTLGTVSFRKNSASYPVPVISGCALNNIVFNATVETDEFRDAIASSEGAVALDNRIYCFGGKKKSNCVFCSKSNNPFYFPKNSKVFLGDGTTPVTALKVQNGKLIAFKPGETYRVITSAKGDREVAINLPETSSYTKSDTLSAQTIDNSIGCVDGSTVRLCGNRLVWLGGDGGVYALATTTYGNTTNIFRISRPIDGRIKEALSSAENIFALTNGGQYMLFAGKTVFVMNHRVRGFGYSKTYYAHDDEIKSPAWYVWETAEGMNFLGGSVVNGQPVLVCGLDDGLGFYTGVIEGENDVYLTGEDDLIKSVSVPFSSGFTTKLLDCGARYRAKSLYSLLISSLQKSLIKIRLSNGKNSFLKEFQSEGGFDYVPLGCGIPRFKLLSLSLSSDEAMSVESLCLTSKILAGTG